MSKLKPKIGRIGHHQKSLSMLISHSSSLYSRSMPSKLIKSSDNSSRRDICSSKFGGKNKKIRLFEPILDQETRYSHLNSDPSCNTTQKNPKNSIFKIFSSPIKNEVLTVYKHTLKLMDYSNSIDITSQKISYSSNNYKSYNNPLKTQNTSQTSS